MNKKEKIYCILFIVIGVYLTFTSDTFIPIFLYCLINQVFGMFYFHIKDRNSNE